MHFGWFVKKEGDVVAAGCMTKMCEPRNGCKMLIIWMDWATEDFGVVEVDDLIVFRFRNLFEYKVLVVTVLFLFTWVRQPCSLKLRIAS